MNDGIKAEKNTMSVVKYHPHIKAKPHNFQFQCSFINTRPVVMNTNVNGKLLPWNREATPLSTPVGPMLNIDVGELVSVPVPVLPVPVPLPVVVPVPVPVVVPVPVPVPVVVPVLLGVD
jgi:hypothetical protein